MAEELFPSRSSNAYDRYNQGLSDAVQARDWVYDPSYALANDTVAYKKVMRDPVAAHAIRFRRHLVAGREWQVIANGDRDVDKRAAEVVGELLGSLMGFGDARLRLTEANFRGSAYEFVEGERQSLRIGGSRLQWWAPKKLVNVDRRRFRLWNNRQQRRLEWQFWSVERYKWERLAHPEWFVRSVVDKTEDSLGYGRGLLDTMYTFQAGKSRVLRDAMRASARFGMGFLRAKIKGIRDSDGRPAMNGETGSQTLAEAWARELQNHLAEGVLIHDERDDVDVVTGWGEGYQLLLALLKYYDASQVLTVLGATLNTMDGGGGGSFALAKEHSNSTEALVNTDRERLGEDLTRDLIGLIWRLNRFQLMSIGLAEANMPKLVIIQGKRQDPALWAQVISTLIGAGVKLREEEVYDKTGFTPPAPGDKVIEGTPQANQEDPLKSLESLNGFSALNMLPANQGSRQAA